MSPTLSEIPRTFPRFSFPGAVAGLRPKLATVLVDGKFVEEPTHAAFFERYGVCEDLVTQLEAYCRRKLSANPELPLTAFRTKVRQGVIQKSWGLSLDEVDWVMAGLSAAMAWPSLRAEDHAGGELHLRVKQGCLELFQLSDAEANGLLSGRWHPPMVEPRTRVSLILEELGHQGPTQTIFDRTWSLAIARSAHSHAEGGRAAGKAVDND